jgi:hypothetical protein
MLNVGLQKLEEVVSETFLIKDPHITRFLMATVVSQFLPASPVWPIIVAPSGGGKSEFINMLHLFEWTPPGENQLKQIVVPISTLTSKTFASGYKGSKKDPSLLSIIVNGIITLKDLTSLLSEHPDERGVIWGQFREIYDGQYDKKFGTGEELAWKGKITVIAGSTYIIHDLKQQYAAMGERFIFYNLIQPDREAAAEKTMDNEQEGLMKEKRLLLAEMFRDVAQAVLNNMPNVITTVDKDMRKDTIVVAELATRARSNVQRDFRSPQKEITDVHPPEMPTRFAGQLQTIIQALKVIRGYETGEAILPPEQLQIINKVSLDSIPKIRRVVMQELARYDSIETSGLGTKLGLPTASVRRYLEDITALEIATREKGGGSKGDIWRIRPHYRDVISKFENITFQGGELTEDNAEPTDQQLLDEAAEAKQEADALEQKQQDLGLEEDPFIDVENDFK